MTVMEDNGIQVREGAEEEYLWPNEEIRKRAYEAMVKTAEKVATERFEKLMTEYHKKMEAAYTELTVKYEDAKKKAEELSLRLARLPESMDELKKVISDDLKEAINRERQQQQDQAVISDLHSVEDALREVGKLCWMIGDAYTQAENKANQFGIYDSDVRRKLLNTLFFEHMGKHIERVAMLARGLSTKLNVYGEY